jgi:hypothetical protein
VQDGKREPCVFQWFVMWLRIWIRINAELFVIPAVQFDLEYMFPKIGPSSEPDRAYALLLPKG